MHTYYDVVMALTCGGCGTNIFHWRRQLGATPNAVAGQLTLAVVPYQRSNVYSHTRNGQTSYRLLYSECADLFKFVRHPRNHVNSLFKFGRYLWDHIDSYEQTGLGIRGGKREAPLACGSRA
jgi:hypothetical protein